MKQKVFAWIALLGFFGSITLPVQAAMISTPDVIQSQQSAYDREQLSSMLERDMPAGGILGAIVLIFVVFVITDAIGATDIFPFVRPVR